VTLLSAFFAKTPPRGLNIYFIICLSLVSLSHVLLEHCVQKYALCIFNKYPEFIGIVKEISTPNLDC
ncbi:hypothetical protein TNCT_424921, partial [Trichonephila clavata]